MQLSRWSVITLSCAAITLGVAACGSSNDNNSGSSGTASTAAPATSTAAAKPSTGGYAQATIDYGLKYTGGTAGKADASKPPVTIGFISEQGGSPSFPEHEAAADATVKLINEQLGGIQGHPFVLDKCVIASEEDGQKCGAKLSGDKMPVINNSLLVVGNASLYKTVSPKIPVINSVTPAAQDTTTEGAYSFNGAGLAVIGAMAKDAAQNVKAKNVALVSVNNPGGKFTMEKLAVPSFDALKVQHGKVVYYGESPTTPDIVSALQAAGGSNADLIFFDPSAPQECVSLFDAMKQLNITVPVESTPICNADVFVDHTGAGPTNWRFWGFADNPRVTTDPQVKVNNDIMKVGGAEKYVNTGFSDITTSDLLTIAKFANEIGADKLTPEAFHAAIKAFRGPVFLVPGSPNCETPPNKAQPSICGSESIGSTFVDGAWKGLGSISSVE